MDQMQPSSSFSPSPLHSVKHTHLFLFLIPCCVLVAFLCTTGGYLVGYMRGVERKSAIASSSKRKNPNIVSIIPTPSIIPYTLAYTIPSGWSTTIWHPTDTSTASALLSPDYTANVSSDSADNPNPQTGMAVVVYRYPDAVHTLQDLRSATEITEDGMQSLSPATVAGLPAYHAIFISTDSYRVIDDYHFMKGIDHWVIRFVFHGNSLSAMQSEEQKYQTQITALLQSIQFQ